MNFVYIESHCRPQYNKGIEKVGIDGPIKKKKVLSLELIHFYMLWLIVT